MGNMKILNTNTAIYTIELHEAKVVPFKKLEQAWTRTNGDKAKQAKLIKKYDLKTLISKVRPGSIKLGVMNKLNHVNGNATAAGTDLDGELIFITNNPLKIIYPKKSSRRPEGAEIEEADDGAIVEEKVEEKKSLSTLRLEKVASLAIKEDDQGLIEAFVKSETFSIDSTTSEIKEAYKIFESSVKWIIYDKKTGKQLSPSKSWRKWQGAKMAAAKIGGNAEPADAAWYHDNKAKLLGESTDLEEGKIPSSNIAKFSSPQAAKRAASKQKYMTQVFMGDDDKFWVPSTNKEAGQLKKDGYEVYEAATWKSEGHYTADGKEWTGDQHEVDGQVMTGKVHSDDSVDLYHFKELTPEVRKQVAASFE
tara:strand:+ start:790 stop:1881 length:1092 start_codon:yes stop_codon:yes gene_type:complete